MFTTSHGVDIEVLYATLTEPVEFQVSIGTLNRKETYPAGTEVAVDVQEMDENPKFFPVTITGTDTHIHAYVSIHQIQPA